MVHHTFLILYRNFIRFKNSFLINMISLSTGLASALLIYLWVSDELSVDKFHERDNRLFQVMQNMTAQEDLHTTDATPGVLADALQQEIPEIEQAVTEYPGRGSKGIISYEGKSFNAVEQYVTPNYFDVFSYNLLHGSRNHLLSDKHAVLISDELAMKLFNTTEAVGKVIEWDQGNLTDLKGQYHASGVFEKPGRNSSNQFDVIFSYDLLRDQYGAMLGLNGWSGSDPHTHVLLKEGTDPDKVSAKIRDFVRTKYEAARGTKDLEYIGTLFLQKYSDRYLNNRYENGFPSGGRIAYVQLFSFIAALILVLACINFMNLATARVTGRLKEIGIKKTLGASRSMIASQFLKESVAMAFLTLPLAILVIQLCLPYFNGITGKHLTLRADPVLLVSIMAITLLTGFISGSYPALYLSRFRPADVLKGKFNSASHESASWLRSALVIFQFSISVILIVFVLVIYRQVDYIHTKNLGYTKDNVIRFVSKGRILETGSETFLNEVRRIPGVVDAASYQSSIITKEKRGTLSQVEWDGKDPDVIVRFSYMRVGYGLIETLGMDITQGCTFSEERDKHREVVVLNEAALASMGITDPIGKTIHTEGVDKIIVGVIRDFHFESFYEPIKPCILLTLKRPGDNLMVRIKAGSERETLERLETFYRAYNDGLSFEYDFLDEDYKTVYASEQRVASLSQYFAAIAIVISCLGLFGLTAFTAERKIKEIGIRKILGSSVFGIVYLLSKQFIGRILISLLIALPVSYYITQDWLHDFAFRIDLHIGYFAGTGILTILIACATMGFQVIKVAHANPVDSLRAE